MDLGIDVRDLYQPLFGKCRKVFGIVFWLISALGVLNPWRLGIGFL
jgi:hypothetical protein